MNTLLNVTNENVRAFFRELSKRNIFLARVMLNVSWIAQGPMSIVQRSLPDFNQTSDKSLVVSRIGIGASSQVMGKSGSRPYTAYIKRSRSDMTLWNPPPHRPGGCLGNPFVRGAHPRRVQ